MPCPLDDEVTFEFGTILPIREDDIYGGYRVALTAEFETLLTPLSIDVSTGDAITPHAVPYQFAEIFDEEKSYELWAYNIERPLWTEKVETILRRSVFNTRPRDFYDAYILASTQKFDKDVFAQALGQHGPPRYHRTDRRCAGNLRNIEESPPAQGHVEKYRKQSAYAQDITYEQILDAVRKTGCIKKQSCISGG